MSLLFNCPPKLTNKILLRIKNKNSLGDNFYPRLPPFFYSAANKLDLKFPNEIIDYYLIGIIIINEI